MYGFADILGSTFRDVRGKKNGGAWHIISWAAYRLLFLILKKK